MKILYIFLLKIMSDLKMVAAEDSDTKEILCQFKGASSSSSYRFVKEDVHKCCSSVVYGYYFLDGKWNGDYHVVPMDRDPIKTLIVDNKVVYIMLGFLYSDQWSNVFFPPEVNAYNTMRDALIKFLTDFKVKGIILDKPKIYNQLEGLDEKINSFAGEIKIKLSDVKVGIVIDGIGYKNFSNDELFSFSITNENLDLYIIDTTTVNECTQETQKSGVVPIKGQDGNLISLEQMLTAATSSSMDKSKLYAMMELSVRKANFQGSFTPPISFSEFCVLTDQSRCCADDSKMIYEKGKYVRELNYQGIMLSIEEGDDFDSKCECEKFPMTKRIIGGWESKPVEPPCPKLD